MTEEIEDLVITGKQHRLYKKFRKYIENFYKVKINMPQVTALDSDVVFISLHGEESCRNSVKDFISDKMCNRDVQHNENVLVVTLSDSSDDESTSTGEDVSETPSKSMAASNSLHDESVLIIEDPVSLPLNTSSKKSIKKCDLLEDSICIIESPTNSLQQPRANTKRKGRKKRIRSKKKARIEISNCDESKPLSESPALQHSSDFIPVFDLGKNNFKRHKSALNHQPRQGNMNEGEISVIEPCSVNKNVNFLPCTLPSTQNEKNQEIVNIGKTIKNVPTYSLRPVVIDGSNVAREHGKVSRCFSGKGIQLAINFFLNRGHSQVTAFVPMFRRHFNPKHTVPTMNAEIIEDLSKKQLIVFTPSRRVNGKIIQSYDDRFIVQLAAKNGGVIVSNDNYRDLLDESDSFKEAIEQRLLMFCFVGDEFMVPEDPLGRDGPKLAEFLSFPPKP